MAMQQTKEQSSENDDGGTKQRKQRIPPNSSNCKILLILVCMVMLCLLEETPTNRLGIQVRKDSVEDDSYASPTFGVVMVHCSDQEDSWFDEIPSDWNVQVYETCGQQDSPSNHTSVYIQNATGHAEECTAFLDYIQKQYYSENLPNITIFLKMAEDAFGIPDEGINNNETAVGHLPFNSLKRLQEATQKVMMGHHRPFYGWGYQYHRQGMANHSSDLAELWQMVAKGSNKDTANSNNETPSIFAVHKDRIRANPLGVYQQLQTKLQSSEEETRTAICGALPWHVLFGGKTPAMVRKDE